MVGLDEVGRGAWAGPVTVGAVVWDASMPTEGVRDSKLIAPDERERVAAILTPAVDHGVGHASPREIDELGMTAALRVAALRALGMLRSTSGEMPDMAIMDGTVDFLAGVVTTECLPKADLRCTSVAAASIIAKVTRDALMVAESQRFDGFEFGANKGYPAPPHQQALRDRGPTELHRHSWQPVRDVLGRGPYPRRPYIEPAAPDPTLF